MIPDSEYLTTRELAELLRIKERKVYDLAASGQVPCTRATGKLLFSRAAVYAWLAANGEGPDNTTAEPRPNVFLGSHDPLLEWAIQASGCGIASFFDGSVSGLQRFVAREGLAASMHIFEPGSETWNVNAVSRAGGLADGVLVTFWQRSRGIIYHPRCGPIQVLSELQGKTFAGRQATAGAQVLLEHLLNQAGISPSADTFVEVAHTEADAAAMVFEGRADAASGLESYAARYHLGFLPLMMERFDVLVDRTAWFDPPFQTLLGFCRGQGFRERAAMLKGFDISGLGTIRLNRA